MKWKYVLHIDAPVDRIYRLVAPDRWMSFYLPGLYRGLEHVDANWPQAGSSIVLRYAIGPVPFRIRQTIVEHERGRYVRIHEEVLKGIWVDNDEIFLRSERDGAQSVTVVSDQTSPLLLLRWLAPIRWCLNWLDLAPALKRFKAMAEASSPDNVGA
jgi:hypothetical protein